VRKKRGGRGIRTPLQQVDLLQCLPLRLVALLQLRDLHLLAEFLQIALPARVRSGLLARGCVDQLLLDLAHVLVALDHLGEVVGWPRERHAFFL